MTGLETRLGNRMTFQSIRQYRWTSLPREPGRLSSLQYSTYTTDYRIINRNEQLRVTCSSTDICQPNRNPKIHSTISKRNTMHLHIYSSPRDASTNTRISVKIGCTQTRQVNFIHSRLVGVLFNSAANEADSLHHVCSSFSLHSNRTPAKNSLTYRPTVKLPSNSYDQT